MNISSESIKKIRKEQGCGLVEAHKIAVKLDLLENTEDAENLKDLKRVVFRLIHLVM